MADTLQAPPVLATPDTHIFEYDKVSLAPARGTSGQQQLSDEELRITYDIDRTLKEIRQGRWQRIALQFPDEMLCDAPRVFQLLSRGLEVRERNTAEGGDNEAGKKAGITEGEEEKEEKEEEEEEEEEGNVTNFTESFANKLSVDEVRAPRLYILGDTSYGTCCVDEVAAEHVNADVVVHYGRACLSPTARLPVIHIFTHMPLDSDPTIAAFKETYPDREEKVVIAADVTFSDHVQTITSRLVEEEGYTNLFATEVVHDPSSPIPNRTIPDSVREQPETLKEWNLFHISDPPTALLLTLSSRLAAIHIYPTSQSSSPAAGSKAVVASTGAALRRRYAILTRLSTVPIFGILINTLSVKNYLHIVEHVKAQITAAGKKSYMFVVGKLNAAKVANFSEIGGWVVIGCWESSLVDSKDFWKPVITPYELELALKGDMDRVWTGEWRSDYQTLLDAAEAREDDKANGGGNGSPRYEENTEDNDASSEPESAPPEFDLRTGRYISVSSTRPMQAPPSGLSGSSISQSQGSTVPAASRALTQRANGELAMIKGVLSPGAEFLRSQRTWKGLGSDFDIRYEDDEGGVQGSAVVEGRSGIARGYTVGDDGDKH
ncbi:diphthamide biosynthesis protein 2 [Polytolypa hystricis UAMH7299]|uniref:2-(3-amino-3-carboxypropyl)histidine synthase subunit 2 n=1 Tax=Polytolypa hystricis (strain UAMH7299) TaxID=1447883 RepID=A0A2B7YAG3_POLH7|nr:diphthamide biosynthesis protein 2 [Polytolypa hystricis UAMH7299]